MAKLTRTATGRFTARKSIPLDVRDEYQRLYGQGWEAKFSAPKDTPKHVAKALCGAWHAEIEARIVNIRAARNGDLKGLTQRQTWALVGEWYSWYVAQYEDNPGNEDRWWWKGANFHDDLIDLAPKSFRENEETDPDWQWTKAPDVKPKVQALISEYTELPKFLTARGLTLNPLEVEQLIDAIRIQFFHATLLLQRRAKGDYTPDTYSQQFPKFEKDGTATPAEASGSFHSLFAAWVESAKPAESTVTRWRVVFITLDSDFPGRSASSLTPAEAKTWIDGLISESRTARTVADVWLSAAKTVFQWAKDHQKLQHNPFEVVKVTVPKQIRRRESKAFDEDEIKLILRATLLTEHPRTAFERAKRWAPWLCAYSGARAGEITQMRGSDVVSRDALQYMRLTPDAGTIKGRVMRSVPLHEHIVAQGFLDMVRTVGPGPLFYNPIEGEQDSDPLNPVRSRAVKARERLAAWVRDIGVTDPEVKPNHAWRHTFKQRAARFGIPERIYDAITGHAPATVGRSYGAPTVEDMANELVKFKRYEI